MRILSTIGILACLLLPAACGNETPAQQAATRVCLEDTAGNVLSVVAGTIDSTGKVTAGTVVAGAGTVLASAAADPNCAAAIAAAGGGDGSLSRR